MPYKSHSSQQDYAGSVPVIDVEFDSFDLGSDLEIELRESEFAKYYHSIPDMDE